MEKTIMERITGYMFLIVIGLVLAFLITRMVSPVTVSGVSMNPVLESEEKLLMNKIVYKISEPERGDIIAFKPQDSVTDHYVKRIVAIPGDIIEIRNNRLLVNELVVDESEYLLEPMQSEDFKMYKLQENEYFALGDNRNHSRDSRYFGPVKEKYIIGKIIGKK